MTDKPQWRNIRAMKKLAVIILVAAAFFAAEGTINSQGRSVLLDDFSGTAPGNIPKRWRTWPLQRSKAAQVYKIAEEDGFRYIRAYDASDLSQQIFLNFNWRTESYPKLSWKWRPTKLPDGANESNDASNDSACGVYVIFGQYTGNAIKYVWSTGLPIGKTVTRRDGKLKIKVLESGPENINSWKAEKVDVIEDYKKLFGSAPEKRPSGIALLTDGNAVHKPSGCDYSAFEISSE